LLSLRDKVKPFFASTCFTVFAPDDNDSNRVDTSMTGGNALMKWSMARDQLGLSVNTEHNLLVASEDEPKLHISLTHGTMLQDLSACAQNVRLQHGSKRV